VTVAAHLQAGTDGYYGAALLEAADSSVFSDGGNRFTSQSAAVGLAFNTTGTDLSEGVVLPSMDDTSLDISDQRLRDYLAEVPAGTFRLFTSGEIGFLGLGVSAELMAQADPAASAVDVVASGDLNLGLLGEVEAFGSLRLDPAGTAGRLDVTGPFNIPDGLEIDGDATFEFNTSNTGLDVLLTDEPVAAGPQATLHVGSSGGPATMTLLGVTLSGTADVRISPNAFGLDAGLDLSVEIPKDVSVPEGFPDSIEGASAETTIEFSNGALRQAEFEFSVLGFSVFGQEVHFDVHATLYRSGCLSMSIAGSPFPVQFNVLKGEPSCTPRLYVDDINVIKGEYTAQIPVTVAPLIDEDVRFTFFFEDGSAVLGTHYKAVSGFQQGSTIVVPAGQSTVNVPVGILDPSTESGDRSFTFEINSGSLEPEAVKAGDLSATITILDVQQVGPPVTVHLEPVGDLRLKENEGPARLKIHAPELLADDSVKVAYFVVPREPGLETATLGATSPWASRCLRATNWACTASSNCKAARRATSPCRSSTTTSWSSTSSSRSDCRSSSRHSSLPRPRWPSNAWW
jgi:hypothetical protein